MLLVSAFSISINCQWSVAIDDREFQLIEKVTFHLLVFYLFVDFSDETLYAVVLSVRYEVGEVDRLLAMRLRSRNQPQSTQHARCTVIN